MSQGAWLAFFNLYLETKGLTGTQIGILGGMYQAAIFLFAPLLGILGDKYGIKRLSAIVTFCSTILLFFFQVIDQYFLIIIYTLLLASFTQPIGSLFDSLAITFVRNKKHSSFGKLRVWGSIGWAISTYLVGLLLAKHNINLIFTIAGIISFMMMIVLWMYDSDESNDKLVTVNANSLKFLLHNKPLIIFYSILTLYGIAVAPIYVFINLYFTEIGAGYDIIGIAFSLQALSEIPFFFFGTRFVKKYGSEASIIISLMVTLCRMILYSIITDPIYAVIVGIGQGFTLSLFLVAVVEYVHDIIPDNLRATGQSLIWATHFGAGITIGNIITGAIYDTIGIKAVLMFDGLFIGIIAAGLMYFFKQMKKS